MDSLDYAQFKSVLMDYRDSLEAHPNMADAIEALNVFEDSLTSAIEKMV